MRSGNDDPRSTWRVRVNALFAGITWGAIAFILMLCAMDAFRDMLVAIVEMPLWRYLRHFWRHLYPTVLMSLVMMLAVTAALNHFRTPDWRQSLAVAVAVLFPCALGTLLKLHLLGYLYIEPEVIENWFYQSPGAYFAWYFVRYAVIGLLLAAAYTMHRRERERLQALQQTELEQAQLRQQMDEAHLQALAAQIEPHFLFNTLANVRSLYRTDAEKASLMLENLVRYLAIALPRMRESGSTFAREAALAEAFLSVQKIRMGTRLTYSIKVDEALAESSLPPMMLLTLVENAIKHGVGPLREGGDVTVRAAESQGQVMLEVADNGRGFTTHLGNGSGLANIRARLGMLYGGRARLRLSLNEPTGVIATITLPRAEAEIGA